MLEYIIRVMAHLMTVTGAKLNHVNKRNMKNLLLLLSFVFSSVHVYGQLGYFYKSQFISLTPDSSLYYIQTQTSEQLSQLKESFTWNNDNVHCVSTLSDNSCVFISNHHQ